VAFAVIALITVQALQIVSALRRELERIRLHYEVLRLMVHHVLDDLPRVLAPVLDQTVEFRDCLVLVHGEHCVPLFCAGLGGAVVSVVGGRVSVRVRAHASVAIAAGRADEQFA
jgi:hypothetical protein